MTKKQLIQFFVLPLMRSASAFLRFKDSNSTGADDEAADAIDYATAKLEKWVSEPDVPKP